MKASNLFVAMQLLLTTDTFSAEALKTLTQVEKSEIHENPTIQRLEAMFDNCKEKDILVDDTMVEYFPGKQPYFKNNHTIDLNMIEFANVLASHNEVDEYCIAFAMRHIARSISLGYNTRYDLELNRAIDSFDIDYIRATLEDAFPTSTTNDFVKIHCDFLRGFQKVLNYAKRCKHLSVIRPNVFFRTKEEFDNARAKRYSDYARYSLHSLGEVLAIFYPIWISAMSGQDDYHFNDLLLDFPIGDIVKLYIEEARVAYGECYGEYKTEDELYEALLAYPSVFYDPEEEPTTKSHLNGLSDERQESTSTIKDIKIDFPAIAKIFFEDFYA